MNSNKTVFFLFVTVLVLLSACKQGQQKMQVDITVQNNPAKQVVSLIGKSYGESAVILDTVSIAAGNNTAHFETLIPSESIYSIRFEKENRYILFSNDAPAIKIVVDWNNFPGYSVSSPASASLKNLLVTYNGFLTAADSTRKDTTQTLTDSMRNVITAQAEEKTKKAMQFLTQYTDTAKSPAVAIYALGILQQQQNDSVIMKPLIQKLAVRFPTDENVDKLNKEYTGWLQQQKLKPGIGKTAPSFSLPDTSGKIISLESFRGKYTLVDFWASWCAPCRKENPAIVAAYETFKDKNFTILGVSLDKDKTAWLQAIHTDKLVWQQVSDLKEWNSIVVPPYYIKSIPYNVLIDSTGKIIAMNLGGEALHRKLAEVLK